MRIDLPQCSFDTCRYYFDNNCTSKKKFEACEYGNPIKGEWLKGDGDSVICSGCYYKHSLGEQHQNAANFCPNCGLEMSKTKGESLHDRQNTHDGWHTDGVLLDGSNTAE